MKIAFSCALAFVLSLFCFPQLSFAPHTSPSTISAAGWPVVEELVWEEDGMGSYTYLGEFPQSYVGDDMDAKIKAGLSSGTVKNMGNFGNMGAKLDISAISPDKPYAVMIQQTLAGENQDLCEQFGVYDNAEDYGYRTYYSGPDGNYGNKFDAGSGGDVKIFYIEPIKWYLLDDSDTYQTKLISEAALYANVIQDHNTDISSYGEIMFELTNQFNMGPNKLRFISIGLSGLPAVDDIDYGDYAFATASDFAIATGAVIDPYLHLCNWFLSDCTSSQFFSQWIYLQYTYDFAGILHTPQYLDDDMGLLNYITAYCCRPMLVINMNETSTAPPFDEGISNYPGITKKSDGYHITDFTGLQAMSDFTNLSYNNVLTGKFYLDNDIDCKGKTLESIQRFSGTFDGQEHNLCNFNSENFIMQSEGCTIQNLNILNWQYNKAGNCALVFDTAASTTTTLQNIYLEISWSGVYNSAAIVGLNDGILKIQNVGICGTISTIASSGEYAAAFVRLNNNTISLSNSFFNGYKAKSGDLPLVSDGAGGADMTKLTLSGVYLCYANSKQCWRGFTDLLWVCNPKLNGGYPALRQHLWVGSNLSAQTVTDYLRSLNFTMWN